MSSSEWKKESLGSSCGLSDGQIARVFFCEHDGAMVLLHGIVKKTQKAPAKDLDLAMKRLKGVK